MWLHEMLIGVGAVLCTTAWIAACLALKSVVGAIGSTVVLLMVGVLLVKWLTWVDTRTLTSS